MKKGILFALVFYAFGAWAAEPMPTSEIFKAMQDEMTRTQQQLKMDGYPRPFFTAYKLEESREENYVASLGEILQAPKGEVRSTFMPMAHMLVGNEKTNNNGFDNPRYYFWPNHADVAPANYDAIRNYFWYLSNQEYTMALDGFAQKEAYKRQKNIQQDAPDFARALPASYQEEIPLLAPQRAYYEGLVKQLSALGKKYKRVEKATAAIKFNQNITRYVNSEGAWYQTGNTWVEVALSAQTRNKDGYKSRPSVRYTYTADSFASQEELRGKAQTFFEQIENAYAAKKAEPYLGPVLLKGRAAADFLETLFVQNVRHSKPLLTPEGEDRNAGAFKDKVGLRVLSHLFDVQDKPLLRQYKGQRLLGFMPVDDEGVAAQNLELVKNGKLVALPSTRNLSKGQKTSNAHARMSFISRPRSALTSVFFTPKKGFSAAEMEQKLLTRCAELDLEYCYIIEEWPGNVPGLLSGVFAKKIYVKDGHQEPVYGARLQNLTPRSLRDISAAGTDAAVFNYYDDKQLLRSMVSPSLLVEEMEIVPDDLQPDRAPFVSQPH